MRTLLRPKRAHDRPQRLAHAPHCGTPSSDVIADRFARGRGRKKEVVCDVTPFSPVGHVRVRVRELLPSRNDDSVSVAEVERQQE